MGNFKIHLFSKIIYTLVYLSEIKKQLWDKKASNFACVASFYVCGSSSRNCLKQGHPVNYRNYSSSLFNEVFVTTSLELHQVKAAKHLHHTFQITDTFLQSSANAWRRSMPRTNSTWNVLTNWGNKLCLGGFLFVWVFKEIKENLKISEEGWGEEKKKPNSVCSMDWYIGNRKHRSLKVQLAK